MHNGNIPYNNPWMMNIKRKYNRTSVRNLIERCVTQPNIFDCTLYGGNYIAISQNIIGHNNYIIYVRKFSFFFNQTSLY